jgi:hypothetical protein
MTASSSSMSDTGTPCSGSTATTVLTGMRLGPGGGHCLLGCRYLRFVPALASAYPATLRRTLSRYPQKVNASGGHHVEVDGSGNVIVNLDIDQVDAEGLDRVADLDASLVDLRPTRSLDGGHDVGRSDRAE